MPVSSFPGKRRWSQQSQPKCREKIQKSFRSPGGPADHRQPVDQGPVPLKHSEIPMPHESPHPPILSPALRDAVVRCEEENRREWSLSLKSWQAFGTETCGMDRVIITHPGNTGQLPEWLRTIDSGGMNMAWRPVNRHSIAYLLVPCMGVFDAGPVDAGPVDAIAVDIARGRFRKFHWAANGSHSCSSWYRFVLRDRKSVPARAPGPIAARRTPENSENEKSRLSVPILGIALVAAAHTEFRSELGGCQVRLFAVN